MTRVSISRVLTANPRLQVIRRKIPIRIKNVENPKGGGTVIHPDPDTDGTETSDAIEAEIAKLGAADIARGLSLKPLEDAHSLHQSQYKVPTAVTIKEHIVVINVNSNRKSVSHGFLAGIFGALDRFGVVVDLISTSEVHVSMAIEDGIQKKMLDRVVRELQKSGTVSAMLLLLSHLSSFDLDTSLCPIDDLHNVA